MNSRCRTSLSAELRETSTSTARVVLACPWTCARPRSPTCTKSACSVPVSGGTATWRMPSMKAANTNSAFDGQRRYTVALLARALAATASTVSPSYPCSCRSCNVTASSALSRGDHGDDSAAGSAIWVTALTLERRWQYCPVPYCQILLGSVAEVADAVPVHQRPSHRRTTGDHHSAEIWQPMAGRQAVLGIFDVHQGPVHDRSAVRERNGFGVTAVVDLLDGGSELIVEFIAADRARDGVLAVALEPIRWREQIGLVGPLGRGVVVPASIDFPQTGQDFD